MGTRTAGPGKIEMHPDRDVAITIANKSLLRPMFLPAERGRFAGILSSSANCRHFIRLQAGYHGVNERPAPQLPAGRQIHTGKYVNYGAWGYSVSNSSRDPGPRVRHAIRAE